MSYFLYFTKRVFTGHVNYKKIFGHAEKCFFYHTKNLQFVESRYYFSILVVFKVIVANIVAKFKLLESNMNAEFS